MPLTDIVKIDDGSNPPLYMKIPRYNAAKLIRNALGFNDVSTVLTVTDPTLWFDSTTYDVFVGNAQQFTLYRNSFESAGILMVALSSTDTNVFTPPATITFPAGENRGLHDRRGSPPVPEDV